MSVNRIYLIILGLAWLNAIVLLPGCGIAKKPPLKSILPEQPSRANEIAWENASLKDLKERLYSSDAEQRVLAADRLVAWDSKKSVRALKKALKSDRPDVVQSILKVLALYEKEIFLEPVLNVLETRNNDFKTLIYKILSNFSSDELAKMLLARLSAPEKSLAARRNLVQALGYTKNKQAVAPLMNLLPGKKDSPLFPEIQQALKEITRHTFPTKTEWLNWWATHKEFSRERWLDEAIMRYQQSLSDKNKQVAGLTTRMVSLKINLLRLRLDQAKKLQAQESELSLLRVALDDEHLAVQKYAVEQLRTQPKDKVKDLLPKLMELMNAPAKEIRDTIVITLGDIGDEGVIDILIAVLADTNENVNTRKNAAIALGKIGQPRPLNTLTYLLKENNPTILMAIIEALGKIKNKEATAPLIECLQDKEKPEEIQRAVIDVLGEIKDPQSIDIIIEFLKDERKAFRWSAAHSLGQIGDPKAVDPLLPLLNDEFADIRQITAEALGQIGARAAAPALIKMLLNDQDSRARELAAIALGKIKDTETINSLLPSLKDADEKVSRAVWNSILLVVNDDIELGEKVAEKLAEMKSLARAADLYQLLVTNPKFQTKELIPRTIRNKTRLAEILMITEKSSEAIPYLEETLKYLEGLTETLPEILKNLNKVELQFDLVRCLYFKKDYRKTLEEIKIILTANSLSAEIKTQVEEIKKDCETQLKNSAEKPE